MASKYDTNPLDPDFAEKARAKAEADIATAVLHAPGGAETRQFAGPPTEEQTRRFADVGYEPPYAGNYMPARSRVAALVAESDAGDRKIEKLGLRENIAIALPYLPWFIGLIAGAVLLVLLPKSEAKARFHAAQGLAAHIGILAVTTVLGMIDNITDVADAANVIFQAVTTVMLIIFTVKAWRGRPVHIESIEALTNWLEEKIDPKLVNH